MISVEYILGRIKKLGLTDLEVANGAGIDNSNFTRWRKNGKASQESLFKVKQWLDKNYPDFVLNDPGVDDDMGRLQYQINDIARSINLLNERMKIAAANLQDLINKNK